LKKYVSILLCLLFLAAAITGLTQEGRRPGEESPHDPIAKIFAAVAVVHIFLNRNALGKYLGIPRKAKGQD
jgi:hypothetical protein